MVKETNLLLGLLLVTVGTIVGFLLSSSMQPHRLLLIPSSKDLRNQSLGQPKRIDASATPVESTASRLQRVLRGSHRQTNISCELLIKGDKVEQEKALKLQKASDVPDDFSREERFAANDCQTVRRDYVTKTLSQEEADFPIAVSLVVYKDFYQVEKLFRAVYRPEHFYCFHVDYKSSEVFYKAVAKYASCFPNAVLADKRSDVRWETFTILEANLSCMKKLMAISDRWRYFINLVGQEYPLRTMLELVRILKALNGTNHLDNAGTHSGYPPLSVHLPDGPKRAIKWYKSSVYITVTRGFVEYALSDVGRQISEHLRKHSTEPTPDETFFATLNFNPDVLKVPGADLMQMKTDNVKNPFLNRYVNWLFGRGDYPCLSGKGVRNVCIWGVKDLLAMNKRYEFFVNKLYYNFQRFALQCMIERFWNNTMADYDTPEVKKTHVIPLSFYTKFEVFKKHL